MLNTTNYGSSYPPTTHGMHRHLDPSNLARELMASADSNGDGKISKSEFESLMKNAGKTDTTTIDNLFVCQYGLT